MSDRQNQNQNEAAGGGSALTEGLERLLPCPFCGSTNISGGEVYGENRDGTVYKQTGCLDCGALGPMVTPEDVYDEQGCNDAWNTRSND